MKFVKMRQWILIVSIMGFSSWAIAQDANTTTYISTDQPDTTVTTVDTSNPPDTDNPTSAETTTVTSDGPASTIVTTDTNGAPVATVTTDTQPATTTTVTTAVQPVAPAADTTTTAAPATMTVTPAHTAVMTESKRTGMTPMQVLQRLKEGNQRFMSGTMKYRDLLAQANTTAAGQYPVAVVLNCMDSRTPPEIVFDQGIGDVFAIRIGGNIINDDILGSMEFGTKLMGAKLIAVIGHTSCGAIRGACQQAKLGFLTGLLRKIQPAVTQAANEQQTHDCSNSAFIDQIAKDNVMMVVKQIQTRSPVIKKLIQNGEIAIVGGLQDIATGQVTFFDDQMLMQKPSKKIISKK